MLAFDYFPVHLRHPCLWFGYFMFLSKEFTLETLVLSARVKVTEHC